MSQCIKPCVECPWINDNNHNKKFREWSDKMYKLGKRQRCHMKTNDIWGKSELDKNSCVGKLIHDKTISIK
jgi:hypothetical protein